MPSHIWQIDSRTYAAALVALSACWRGAPDAVAIPEVPRAAVPSRAMEQCREAGAVLHVTACRRDDALQWRVVNQGSRPLWVFLRMPSRGDGSLDDGNALVTGIDGHLLVVKATPTHRIEEQPFGVVSLAAGDEARGTIELGRRVAGDTVHLTLGSEATNGAIRDVALIVGFAQQQSGDAPTATQHGPAFIHFDPARQQLVRTAPVPW